jgi:Rps23 Pro-64 3,4-dihydroxylase Tpa1-like proline 4-hydroxylase
MQHTSFEVTYMYGTLASSQSMGRCVITSIGEMFPAITHNLNITKPQMSMILNDCFYKKHNDNIKQQNIKTAQVPTDISNMQ